MKREVDRPRFKVTFHLVEGTKEERVLYADNAEHAIAKARRERGDAYTIKNVTAEEV